MRVFLDANILYSAAATDGAVRALLVALRRAGHECWADEYVVAEARANLSGEGDEALRALSRVLRGVRVAPARVSQVPTVDTRWLPEEDQVVLAAAIRLGCDALVTGDRTHFGRGYGRTFGGVTIHSPRSLADAAGL
jgi:predicted nucleic acid-binding protein